METKYGDSKRETYIVCVNFCNDFLYCILIPHVILFKGLLQLFHCNIPDSEQKRMIQVLNPNQKRNPDNVLQDQHNDYILSPNREEKGDYPLLSLSKYSKAVYKCSSLSILFKCMVAVINSI